MNYLRRFWVKESRRSETILDGMCYLSIVARVRWEYALFDRPSWYTVYLRILGFLRKKTRNEHIGKYSGALVVVLVGGALYIDIMKMRRRRSEATTRRFSLFVSCGQPSSGCVCEKNIRKKCKQAAVTSCLPVSVSDCLSVCLSVCASTFAPQTQLARPTRSRFRQIRRLQTSLFMLSSYLRPESKPLVISLNLLVICPIYPGGLVAEWGVLHKKNCCFHQSNTTTINTNNHNTNTTITAKANHPLLVTYDVTTTTTTPTTTSNTPYSVHTPAVVVVMVVVVVEELGCTWLGWILFRPSPQAPKGILFKPPSGIECQRGHVRESWLSDLRKMKRARRTAARGWDTETRDPHVHHHESSCHFLS